MKPIDLNRSVDIGKLALALSQAQGEITGAKKGSTNPFFKSAYADLAACWDACRDSLSNNKLAVIQTTDNCPDGVIIITTLVHESNQWVRGHLTVKPNKTDPQAMGSAITYGRRYALSAIVGLAQVDDDGNAATMRPKNRKPEPEPTISKDQVIKVETLVADTGSEIDKFLRFAGAETFETIPAKNYKRCVEALRAKKELNEQNNKLNINI